jgi:hypothetical protein
VIHVILDNYACPRAPKVLAWLARLRRWGLSLHPDLRLVAQCGRDLLLAFTRRRPKRGVFRSIVELQAAINRCLAEHNEIVHHEKPHKRR